MPRDPAMRSRSRCIFSASDSSAPLPIFLLSTSIRSAPVLVSRAHRSSRSFSSARGRRKVSNVPSGDRVSWRGCDPDRSGLPNTRARVSFSPCGAVAGAGAAASSAIAAFPVEAAAIKGARASNHARILSTPWKGVRDRGRRRRVIAAIPVPSSGLRGQRHGRQRRAGRTGHVRTKTAAPKGTAVSRWLGGEAYSAATLPLAGRVSRRSAMRADLPVRPRR